MGKLFKSKNIRDDVSFEDVIIDKYVRRLDVIETPLPAPVFRIVLFTTAVCGLVLLGRIALIGIQKNDFYARRAVANSNRETEISAPRGIIFDRYDTPLVQEVPEFSAQILISELINDPDILEDISRIIDRQLSVDELLKSADIERSNIITVAHGISLNEAAQLKNLNSTAVAVTNTYRRTYIAGEAFSHILGYTGAASPEELARDQNISFHEMVGKDGLELFYDDLLRGERGITARYYNARGDRIEEKTITEAQPGKPLRTTIDAGLQQYFFQRMSTHLNVLERDQGAAIALNPQNGEILALLSFPAFDNNVFTNGERADERRALLQSSTKTLFNRAIAGAYSPGSAIKPIVGIAALHENIINPETQFFSPGYIEIPNPYDPEHPSRFLDWKPNGWVDIYSAIAKSSNIFFYYAGGGYPLTNETHEKFEGLGIERLRSYWKEFLLAKKTGIDLPGETTGMLPDPKEKEQRTGQPWRIGDTYNVSIGQGDLLLTPIQLLNAIAAIAAKGELYRPHVLYDALPELRADLSKFSSEMKEIERGMLDTTQKEYGTAYSLSFLPFPVAAKTGSAQILNNTKTNAFFVGYAIDPVTGESPLAILVLIEDAREGSVNTIPIARDVFLWYYENRMVRPYSP